MKTSRKPVNKVSSLRAEVHKCFISMGKIAKNYQDFAKMLKKMNEDSALKKLTKKTECPHFIPDDIQTELDHYLKDTVCFVIYGQSAYAKSVALNELIGKQMICVQLAQTMQHRQWRTMRFKYGLKQMLTLSLPDDNYDLMDDLTGNGQSWQVIPAEDMILHDTDGECDSAHTAAALDVCVNASLLKEGAMIVMTPTYDKTSPTLSQQVFQSCTGASKLIVPIYALENELLSEDSVGELALLKTFLADETTNHAALLITVVPPLEQYSRLCREREQQSLVSLLQKPSMNVDSPFQSQPATSSTSSSSLSSSRLTLPSLQGSRSRSPYTPPPSPQSPMRPFPPVSTFIPLQESRSTDSGMGSLEVPPNNSTQSGTAAAAALAAPAVTGCSTATSGSGATSSQQSANPTDSASTTGSVDNANSSTSSSSSIPVAPLLLLLEDVLITQGLLHPSFPNAPPDSSTSQRDIRENSFGSYNTPSSDRRARAHQHYRVTSVLNRDFISQFTPSVIHFTAELVKKWIFRACQILLYVHQDVLQSFVLLAYELAYDIMVTPKKIEFARARELKLYDNLMKKTRNKQPELQELISVTIRRLKEDIPTSLGDFQCEGLNLSLDRTVSAREYKLYTYQLRQHVLLLVDDAISNALSDSITDLRETYGGAIQRCIEALEKNSDMNNVNSPILPLQSILQSAYEVRVAQNSTANFVSHFFDKLKELLYTMPWQPGLTLDDNWKQKVAHDLLNNISETKIFRHTCEQITNRLKVSHEDFVISLRRLEVRIELRNSESGEVQDRIRRSYAPKLAHMALLLTAMRDSCIYSIPPLHRELGRGQYGVVYSVAKGGIWGPYVNCCVKSVVPPDEKHWQDLALEFFYTCNMGHHDRVVCVYGAVIETNFSGGNSAVLMIMERMKIDLHGAIKNGLSWQSRLQVAIDVMEGIRYMHAQGLIHRDIKLKNVLLDKNNRAKLTDLGFCKPHSMMSGSIVGTPIHMAPELLRGEYHSSVDVYAFGILLWYVCANTVKLPYKFEHYNSKDELWVAVKNGLRPEKLPEFDEGCWQLMSQCWMGDPQQRPFPGDVERSLRAIYSRTVLGVWDNSEEIKRVDYQRMERKEKQSQMLQHSSSTSSTSSITRSISLVSKTSHGRDDSTPVIDSDATPKFTPHPLVVPDNLTNTLIAD